MRFSLFYCILSSPSCWQTEGGASAGQTGEKQMLFTIASHHTTTRLKEWSISEQSKSMHVLLSAFSSETGSFLSKRGCVVWEYYIKHYDWRGGSRFRDWKTTCAFSAGYWSSQDSFPLPALLPNPVPPHHTLIHTKDDYPANDRHFLPPLTLT